MGIKRVKYVFLCTCINIFINTLQKLRHTESDRLAVQVHAYLDNMIDVAQLLEDSETKTEALEKVAELEDEVSHVGCTAPQRRLVAPGYFKLARCV